MKTYYLTSAEVDKFAYGNSCSSIPIKRRWETDKMKFGVLPGGRGIWNWNSDNASSILSMRQVFQSYGHHRTRSTVDDASRAFRILARIVVTHSPQGILDGFRHIEPGVNQMLFL